MAHDPTALDELAASARGLTRKIQALRDHADRQVCGTERFCTVLDDVLRLLEAAHEVLHRPTAEVPRLVRSGSAEGNTLPQPGEVAREMTRSAGMGGASSGGLRTSQAVASISGNARTIAVADLLQFLSSLEKTGALHVRASSETFLVELDQGHVVHASTNTVRRGDRLGDVLIEQGLVDKALLDDFLTRYTRSKGKIGTALEREEIVTRDALVQALEIQVQRIFCRLFALQDATFSFQERPAGAIDNRVRLSIMDLLLESARIQIEELDGI